jgi:tRNA A37 threonylcarbamoyladenosine synthetase subunit TsaC/SUA5/YrdC
MTVCDVLLEIVVSIHATTQGANTIVTDHNTDTASDRANVSVRCPGNRIGPENIAQTNDSVVSSSRILSAQALTMIHLDPTRRMTIDEVQQ